MDWFDVSLWFLFTTVLLQAIRSILGSRHSKLPPGPVPFPIIGNLLELGDKPHKSLAKLAKTHGPIMTLKLGQVTTIIVSSARLAKDVNKTHDRLFSSRTVPDTMAAINHKHNSLVWLPPTAKWRNLRKICNSTIFATQKLDASQHIRSKKVDELVAEVREHSRQGKAVEIGQAAFRTTLNLLSNTVFSVDVVDKDTDSTREFRETVESILEEAAKPNIADCFPVVRAMDPQGMRRRTGVYFQKIYDIFSHLIEQRLDHKSDFNDAVAAMLEINGNGNDEGIKIEPLLVDLFVAGTDTTSNTVEWAMAELLRNPEKLRKVREELEQSVGRGGTVKESHISGLAYLQAVVKETMRLHPVVPLLLPRKAEEAVEICGYTIPKGAQVMVNAWAIGRDPTTWDNPDSFVPERFLGSGIDVKGHDFEVIPFGAGRRICPGMPLAIRMVHLMVASLIHGFEWQLEGGVKAEEMNMDDKFGLTLAMAQPLRAVPVSQPSNQTF